MADKKMGEGKTYFRDEDNGFRDKDGNRISERNGRIEYRIQKHNEGIEKGMEKIPFSTEPDTYNSVKNGEYQNPNRESYLHGYAADPTETRYQHEIKFKELKDSLDRQFGSLNKAFDKLEEDTATKWPKDLSGRVLAGMKAHDLYYGETKNRLDQGDYIPELHPYIEKENRRVAGITKAINNYLNKRKLN